MPRNLEFKAMVNDLFSLEKIFLENGANFVEDLKQADTYFRVQKGRLKLREILDKGFELIFYERNENQSSSMQSDYEVMRFDDPALKNFLVRSLGVKVIVRKDRRLLKLNNARIHLDQVDGLGSFLEFEVVSEGKDATDVELLDRLKKIASPFVVEQINRSYSDLILTRES